MIDPEQLLRDACDLIDVGVFEIDEALNRLRRLDDDKVSRMWVIDILLDIRQTFARYYLVRDQDRDLETAREDTE